MGNLYVKWGSKYYASSELLLPPFQIIRCFGFSRYIAFTMYLDTVYIKSISRKSKTSQIWNEWNNWYYYYRKSQLLEKHKLLEKLLFSADSVDLKIAFMASQVIICSRSLWILESCLVGLPKQFAYLVSVLGIYIIQHFSF
jgi:hypothetical protein